MATQTAVKEEPTLFGAAPIKTKKTKEAGKEIALAAPIRSQAVAPATVAEMISMLAAAASTKKTADLSKMREIRDLIREMQRDEEARAYNTAMLDCQTEIDPIIIKKDGKNKENGTTWARLETISGIIDPIIRRHGFTLSYSMGAPRVPEHYLIVCDVSHRNGHVRRYEADIGSDSKGPKGGGTKTLAQGSGSSANYGRRYLKVMIFDVKIIGADNDGAAPRAAAPTRQVERHQDAPPKHVDNEGNVAKVTQAEIDRIVDAVEDCGVGRPKFCDHYEIDKIEDLPRSRYAEAIQACKDFKENQARKKK